MTCETVGDLLLDYAEGELAPEQARVVREHLDRCRVCAAKYRETRALLGDLGAARSVQQTWNSGQSRTQPVQPATLEEHARLGDFEILEELGRGGMGVVYRARQLSLNRIVALKLLSTGLVQSERAITRFMREAQAAARLHHTNIVPIYAQGQEGDYFYYAMELVEGESLDQVLRREMQASVGEAQTVKLRDPQARAGVTRPLSSATAMLRSAMSTARLSRIAHRLGPSRDFKRIVRLMAGVAEGLHHAHEQGVVHRDIKPQNLLLGPDDELHITDFGLARVLDEPGLTRSTEMVGTPAYMAPEQITGPNTAIDRRTDVYALGVTMYVMLTLRRPFQGEAYEQTIHQILSREPRPPRKIDPRIPVDLETICLRAMEKEPQRRFPTVGEMARDLRRWAEGFAIASRPVGPLGKSARWVRRNPSRASALGTAALVAVLMPLLVIFLIATGNAQVDGGLAVLLDDYRERDRALAEFGWASRMPGIRYRREFVGAFAHIRTAPDKSIEALRGLLEERPDDVDAHYLLAWAYVRRGYTQGTEMWSDAQGHIQLADNLGATPTAAGWFFRGQAVWGSSPEEAVDSFERAKQAASKEGFLFAQAMLHQGRALNQIMYSWREIKHYSQAVAQLESVAGLQPDKAYPRYLLAITHLLAAEIYQTKNEGDEAERAYAASLRAAREAQIAQSESPRGYAVEAYYHESRGNFAAAIDAWNHLDKQVILKSSSDSSERFVYQMRLHFWLGEYDAAEQMRTGRYGQKSGYNAKTEYDADESVYAALIAASAGHLSDAEAALRSGVGRVGMSPEYRLRLHAGYTLIARAAPSDLLPDNPSEECKLSPGWTPQWLGMLMRYVRGETDWVELEAAAREGTQRRDDERLRLAGAYYFRGLRELASGQRDRALASLGVACDQYDNENYCFRAEFLLVKIQEDPGWPAWLEGRGSNAP